MFGPDGELREDLEDLEDSEESGGGPVVDPKPGSPISGPDASTEAPRRPPSEARPAGPERAAGAGESARSGRPEGYPSGESSQVDFVSLIAMLAEPAMIFLGEAEMPGGERVEDLDRARVHIDMLGLLADKTSGNLSSEESAVLSDLLYRLRMRYVEKRR